MSAEHKVWLAWDGEVLLGIYSSRHAALTHMEHYVDDATAEYRAFRDLFAEEEEEFTRMTRERIRIVEHVVSD